MCIAKDSNGERRSSIVGLIGHLISQILSLATQESLIYKINPTNLILPEDPKAKHPLAEKLSLMVPVLSGKNIGNFDTLKTQETFY